MAFDGENLIDLFGGKEDLENKILRAVGNPSKRFEEDALRIAEEFTNLAKKREEVKTYERF
jgi:tRNA nucleotidyltransferase (CCA-adding enzyme)